MRSIWATLYLKEMIERRIKVKIEESQTYELQRKSTQVVWEVKFNESCKNVD